MCKNSWTIEACIQNQMSNVFQRLKPVNKTTLKVFVDWSVFGKSSVMKKVNKPCLLDTPPPRTVRVSEKIWQVIV